MSWLRTFSPPFANALERAVDAARTTERPVAVFDADNTLWSRDIGEAFLRWLIAGRLLTGLDYTTDIYGEYERRVDADRSSAYAWAVSAMAGLKLEDVQTWSRQLAYAWPNYRPVMRTLVRGLTEEGFEVWIVSASNAWSVAAAARYMDIEPERVLGITCRVDSGIITPEVLQPVTCNQGKVDAIRQTIGVRPLLAFGDSLGDLEMLEHVGQPMVVLDATVASTPLSRIATERNWPVQQV